MDNALNRKLRYGMIGGGRGAFIGRVHRIAAEMDGQAQLVAGAFSSDPERSRESGADLRLDPSRVYATYQEMAAAESTRPASERLDFVVIVTPNHQHFPPAKLFLERGFNVICDKPATLSHAEAKALQKVVAKTGRLFVLTHNYTGNAMVKQARDLVRSPDFGKVRKVVVEYPQGWLAIPLDAERKRRSAWRMDPKRSGAGGAIADIGTHAENLARYITGLEIEELCADLTAFTAGGKLDDDGSILVRYRGGAKGIMMASQVLTGEDNDLNIRVYGEKMSLEWHQERSNELLVKIPGQPRQIWGRGNPYTSEAARAVCRIPKGHPEGYLEAFGNIYREAFRAIAAEAAGQPRPKNLDFPTIEDGVEGMAFIETAVKSAAAGAKWTKMPKRR